MAREHYGVERQNFFVEAFEKETCARLQWNLKYSKDFARDLKKMTWKTMELPKLNAEAKSDVGNHAYRKHDVTGLALAQIKDATEGKSPLSDMHPISKGEQDVLFDGFSKDEKGRSKYLKMRKSFDPEEKYRYPQLSSWEYGWNFKHITTPGIAPVNARNRIVAESFYRPTCVQYPTDPKLM
jgi:hypothetical protein